MNTLLTELCSYLGMEPEHTALLQERDTRDVWRQFAIWLLVDEEHGVIRFTKPDSERYQAIKNVAYLYLTNCKDRELWGYTTGAAAAGAKINYKVDYDDAAAAHAASAAYYAAWADATSAVAAQCAALTGRDTATEAAFAAQCAAGAAAAAYSDYAARAAKAAAVARGAGALKAAAVARDAVKAAHVAAYKHMADKLIELLQAAPLKETK